MSGSNEKVILAVDTCLGPGSIALALSTASKKFVLLEQVELAAEWTSTALHVEIAALLSRHRLTTAVIDAYAVTNGPGSFTAIRVGAAAVKGLAEVHRKPTAAISTLALIAQAAEWGESPNNLRFGGLWVPLFDGRRAQVFSGVYRTEGDALRLLGAETVGPLRELIGRIRSLGDAEVRFCSPEIEWLAETIAAAGYPAESVVSTRAALGATLARMGLLALENGSVINAIAVDANYIRASDAELFWKA
jgi:tRNA threonylcarbamoyladenosine biosynthesis protein TsaB